MSNCDLVAGRSLIALAASRLALRAPALRAATALTRPNRSAQWLPCGRHGVPTAVTVGPNHVVANHCVERGNHLAHHGNDRDLRQFAGGFQPSVEDLEHRVPVAGAHRRHVEHVTNGRTRRYYRPTYRAMLKRLTSGRLLHADETEVKHRAGTGYVWALASITEVVYLYRPNREGAFLKEMLGGFTGVLVSDFYAVYDALACPQQKCLIHLIRDLNQEVLTHPFDAELQSIVGRFGALLRSIIVTVDEHGLSRRHLRRHARPVAQFFRGLANEGLSSEPAQALRTRLLKNRERLFTFLEHDGVPWNNNAVENAIRRFAYFRDDAALLTREEGLRDYLVLLSLFQTCRYKAVNFWQFLLSRQKDIDAFAAGISSPGRRDLDLYPPGFEPPHWKKIRERNVVHPPPEADGSPS
jgi:hypothetical protein